jgi:hypothetical protein
VFVIDLVMTVILLADVVVVVLLAVMLEQQKIVYCLFWFCDDFLRYMSLPTTTTESNVRA